jgi:hypothetical protein
VPIIVRSLAESMAMLKEDDLPIAIDLDLLMALDTDLSEQNYVCQTVDQYECAWWKGRKPRTPLLAERLDRSTVDKCLETHLSQIKEPLEPPSNHRTKLPINPSATVYASATEKTMKCPKCNEYSEILSNTLLDILDLHNLAAASKTSAETQWNIDMRRASTFHLLHEAAVIKETAEPCSGEAEVISSVSDNAKMELARLQALPISSHKWTWGEKLTEAEVLALRRSGTKPKYRMHSGYDISLHDGKLTGVDSPWPSAPKSIQDLQDMPPQSTSAFPDYDFPAVQYFKKRRNLIYDPLGKIRPPHTPVDAVRPHSQLADLTSKNLISHNEIFNAEREESSSDDRRSMANNKDVADEWSSAADDMPEIQAVVDVADVWSSGSEEKEENAEPQTTAVVDVADVWSSGSEEKEENAEPQTTAVIDVADVWSSGSEENNESRRAGKEVTSSLVIEDNGRGRESTTQEIEKIWSSASDDEHAKLGRVIKNEWSSASDDLDDAEANNLSSQTPANSQFLASPSKITIDTSDFYIPAVDAWPAPHFNLPDSPLHFKHPDSPLQTPAPQPWRRFGPEDFKNLKDYMFEDKRSDSQSEEEYE